MAQLGNSASKDGRVFLTRDHKLAEQQSASAVYLLAGDNAKEQFRDIQMRFGIRYADTFYPVALSAQQVGMHMHFAVNSEQLSHQTMTVQATHMCKELELQSPNLSRSNDALLTSVIKSQMLEYR